MVENAKTAIESAPIKFADDVQLIMKYINANASRYARLMKDYDRFLADKLPIHSRKIGHKSADGSVIENPYKINRKINNDFAGYIVRTKASYMCSNAVQVEFRDVDDKSEEEFNKLSLCIDDFKKINDWDGLMVKTAETIGATGEGAWIISMENVYGRGIEKINNVMPWEIIEVVKGEVYIRHYITTDENLEELYKVEIYDNNYVTTYTSQGSSVDINVSNKKVVEHLFKHCPVITFVNNDEKQSDFHNVKSLIDQYDRTLSDLASETEQFRLSYLVLTGVEAKPEEVQSFQQTGVFQIKKPDGKAEFITKKMSTNDVLGLLEVIEKNIFRFAESFDSVSTTYTGNLTNFAIHFKTAPMKGRAKKTANFMKMGLYKAFAIIQDTWQIKGIPFNYLDLKFSFNYDDAKNIKEEIETIINAGGKISNETLLGLLSFIDSPANEMLRVKGEIDYMKSIGELYTQFDQQPKSDTTDKNDTDKGSE
ncbi:MAG: phage portal protein [Paraclostridium sp.]